MQIEPNLGLGSRLHASEEAGVSVAALSRKEQCVQRGNTRCFWLFAPAGPSKDEPLAGHRC